MEASLEAFFGSAHVGLGIIDRELRYLRVNDRLAALQGRPVTAYPGRTVPEVLPLLADRLVPTVRRVLETGEGIVDELVRYDAQTLSVSYLPIREGAVVTGAAIVLAEVGTNAQELADRLRFEETLASTSATLLEATPSRFDEAIGASLEMLSRSVGADGAAIYELRNHMDGAPHLDRTHAWALPGRGLGPPASFEVTAGSWTAEGLEHERAVAYSSPDGFPPEASGPRALFEQVGGRALLAVTLAKDHEVLGVLAFYSIEERDWPDVLLPRLRLLGEVVANGLARQRAEQDARARLAFEALLASIAAALVDVSADDVDARIERVLGLVCTATGFVRATIAAFPDDDHFMVTHRWGTDEALVEVGARVRYDEIGITPDDLLSRGKRVWRTEDMPPQAQALRALCERMGYVAMLCFPLSLDGRPIAALTLFSEQPRYDLEHVVARGDVIADLLATAVARKQAELERRTAFEEVERLKAQLERERDYLREEIDGGHAPREIISASSAMRRVLDAVDAVAPTTVSVLVRGESGVGKELVARAVHQRSTRAAAPLVKVDCASIPHDLFERTFFGAAERIGRYELADGGTLFLDEVGEIPLALQARLLRVLQDGTFERVGEHRTRRADVRVVAATHCDLARAVEAGSFRRDLYYRLSAFPVEVPPLRTRRSDIAPLARHFLARATQQLGRPPLSLTDADERHLASYEWPGNVRELEHVIERAVILSPSPPLQLDAALPGGRRERTSDEPPRVRTFAELRELERRNMRAALEQAGGQVAGRGGAAQLLGVSPSTLRDRMRAFGLKPTDRKG